MATHAPIAPLRPCQPPCGKHYQTWVDAEDSATLLLNALHVPKAQQPQQLHENTVRTNTHAPPTISAERDLPAHRSLQNLASTPAQSADISVGGCHFHQNKSKRASLEHQCITGASGGAAPSQLPRSTLPRVHARLCRYLSLHQIPPQLHSNKASRPTQSFPITRRCHKR